MASAPQTVRASLNGRRLEAYAVVVIVAALATWRMAYVLAGPDPDTDAYGHFVIARTILERPNDLTVHWVWLPLFHYIEAGAVLVGATLQSVRLFNVVVSAATPLVLYAFLTSAHSFGAAGPQRARPTWRASWDPTAALAATIAAMNPIAMQMGTTGQTEPLFALLVLGGVWAIAREPTETRAALAGGLLFGLAALLRYEAWAIPPTLLAVIALERLLAVRGVRSGAGGGIRSGGADRTWIAAVVPALTIGTWIAIRRAHDGRWFVFLEEARVFAQRALGTQSVWDTGGVRQVVHDARFYAIDMAYRCFGFPLLLAPFGVVRMLRREGVRFFAIYAALLGAITLSWLMRSQLGLARHLVSVVPFYATCIANGTVAIGDAADAVARRAVRGNPYAFLASGAVRAAAIAGLSCAAVGASWVFLDRWMSDWRHTSEEMWPERRAIAAFLRTRSPQALLFCDEATIEVLTGLDRHRIDRRAPDEPSTLASIAAAAHAGREVYVASRASTIAQVRSALEPRLLAETAFRPPIAGSETAGMIVLRVTWP